MLIEAIKDSYCWKHANLSIIVLQAVNGSALKAAVRGRFLGG